MYGFRTTRTGLLVATALGTIGFGVLATHAAQAAQIMPSFAGAPAGWSTDRYQPTTFSDIGTFQGHSDVLGIGITSAGDLSNRPAAYQYTFYNTQGMSQPVSGGAGSILSADLYVPSSWSDASNGARRTDMWGVMTDGSAVSDYPIIGFTNYGGAARFRIWDEDTGNWVDLGSGVHYDSWNSLAIDFTGSSYEYFVNGLLAYTDTTVDGSVAFQNVIMQAYNFADPSITGAVTNDYTADWSNAVPEPASLLLLGVGLGGLGLVRRRKA